jgi:hypothetical protein
VFIKRTRKVFKGKSYENYLLVESVATPKGPRHKVICSLGSLAPAPREEWLALAQRMQAALSGQASPFDPIAETLIEKTQKQRDAAA